MMSRYHLFPICIESCETSVATLTTLQVEIIGVTKREEHISADALPVHVTWKVVTTRASSASTCRIRNEDGRPY